MIDGEIARAAGLKVPEIVIASLDETFGRTEPDEEIQDLLKASTGINLGLHYLSGSVTFDPVVTKVDSELSSKIVWLDALLMNVDRTARNTNMLLWHKELWLIDHGAALYFHHSWENWQQQAQRPFELIKNHVLVSAATELDEANEYFRQVFSNEWIENIVALIPEEWLLTGSPFATIEEHRQAYYTFLTSRIANSSIFVNKAKQYAGK